MTIGAPGKNGTRNSGLKNGECQEILDVFFKYGGTELDTARLYAEGTTEEVSAGGIELGWGLSEMLVVIEVGFEGCHDRYKVSLPSFCS